MKELFHKYFEGTASKKEQRDILSYLRASDENQDLFDSEKEVWKNSEDRLVSLAAWNQWKNIEKEINPVFSFKNKWVISAISAASVLLLFFSLSFFTVSNQLHNQLVAIHTEAGQLTEVFLPDSTKVFVNSDSRITYVTRLFGFKREVNLEGEAFFDVRSKSFSTFDVISNNIKVHVTGTRFNVKAYKNEDVLVVLEEGSIELNLLNDKTFKQYLLPGEMMKFGVENQQAFKYEVETKDYTSWKDGVLYLENNKLPDLLKSLERRYGVRFGEIQDSVLKELTFTFTIRDEKFDKVMQLLKAALPIKVNTKNQIIEIQLDKEKYEKVKNK